MHPLIGKCTHYGSFAPPMEALFYQALRQRQRDVSSAMAGGQIAIGVIAEDEQNNDFSFDALNNTRRWLLLY